MNNMPFNILLVEDDEVDVINLRRALVKTGAEYDIHATGNGYEALEFLRNPANERPKLILLDLNMPLMTGLEFLKELRSDEKIRTIPVYVLTTSNQDRDIVAAYSYYVAGYILKPLSLEHFNQIVRSLRNFWDVCEFP